jgi:sugar phosphate isomerase/epimerase
MSWQKGVSTHLFINHRLQLKHLESIQAAGFDCVEIFFARQHCDYLDRGEWRNVAAWFASNPLRLNSVHLPMYSDDQHGRSGAESWLNICELDKPRRIRMVDEIRRSLELVEDVPCSFAIQHIGMKDEPWDMRRVDAAFSALEELCLFARHRGTEVLLENIPNEMSSSERLIQFLNLTHLKAGLCLDTGHAHVMESVRNAWDVMGPQVRSTHLHDNNGKSDTHLFPFFAQEASINWGETMALLEKRHGQFPLMLEVRETPDTPDLVDRCRRVMDCMEESLADYTRKKEDE